MPGKSHSVAPKMLFSLLLALFYLFPFSIGFSIHPSKHVGSRHWTHTPKSSTLLNILPSAIEAGGSDAARAYFYIWFFGGSGGIGVALRQFPQQLAKFRGLSTISASGPSEGGIQVGISPLCLYPRDISKADLDKVLRNKLSVEKMVDIGPKPNYLSQRGYLCYDSFVAANRGCNPLTIRAVFDALSTGDNVPPDVAQYKLDSFRDDPSPDRKAFKNELLKTKLAGFSSIAFLMFLLGPIVGSTCLEALSKGWFPEWPGNSNLPWSLLLQPGVWTIPSYWI